MGKEVEVAPGTGESGACSLEATCESPTDCDLNSDRGSEEGGVSTDEGIVGSDEDDKEEKSDADLEKAKKSTEAEKSEVISESSRVIAAWSFGVSVQTTFFCHICIQLLIPTIKYYQSIGWRNIRRKGTKCPHIIHSGHISAAFYVNVSSCLLYSVYKVTV